MEQETVVLNNDICMADDRRGQGAVNDTAVPVHRLMGVRYVSHKAFDGGDVMSVDACIGETVSAKLLESVLEKLFRPSS
ncbi:hypothetical protein Tco_0043065 [Tanacetum coccineum]